MAFVKLDCGILNSTLWVEREPRDVFITALLMAQPIEVKEPMPQYSVRALERTGFVVPPGWYGFVQAAGPGIVRMAMADPCAGMDALEKLGSPDPESRSSDFDGRRLVRVDGGYVILNFMKYRDKDNTSAVRSARYRERKAQRIASTPDELSRRDGAYVTRDASRSVTKAEAEAEAEADKRKRSSPVAQAQPVPAFTGDPNIQGFNAKQRPALATEWELPEEWGNDAERLGWKVGQILKESEKYRQYWTTGKGAGTRRTIKGWRQSWSNWLSKAERYAA